MSGVQFLVCLWTLLIAQSGFVRSEIQFIKKDEGDSVLFPCATEQRNPPPFGVYLKRSWLNQDDMLFKHTGEEFTVGNDQDKNRTSVKGDPSSHSVEVIISKLTVRDTDRYYCEFVVENPSSEDERVKGKTEFFLLVGAGGQCSCSGSSTLFYVLSSAVVALLLLLGFVGIYLCKTRRSVRSHPQAPIYEEMAGVKPRKFPPRHLEDKEHENRNCIVKKSCSDNHYESPSGALFPRRES